MKKYVLALAFLALSGCAAVEKQAFNREANRSIRTVAIIEPRPTTGFGVNVLNHPGLHLGLIGAAVYATEMRSKSETLDTALKPLGWNYTEELMKSLAAELEGKGYKVLRVDLKREKLSMIDSYAEYKSMPAFAPALTADAWLDISTRDALYVANGPTSDYVPSLGLTARMASSKSQEVLFREDYLYGFSIPLPRLAPVLIPSAPQYKFNTMAALTADPKTTLEGLKDGITPLVKRIADDIAPNR